MSSYSNAYVLVPVETATCFLPHTLTVAGVDVEISKTYEPGPIPESLRYNLSWRDKGWTGEGVVDIIPGSSRTSELHVELRDPRGWMSKVFFSSSRLEQPAWGLSESIRNRIEMAAGRRARTEPAKAKRPRMAPSELNPVVPTAERLDFLSRF